MVISRRGEKILIRSNQAVYSTHPQVFALVDLRYGQNFMIIPMNGPMPAPIYTVLCASFSDLHGWIWALRSESLRNIHYEQIYELHLELIRRNYSRGALHMRCNSIGYIAKQL